jgi:carboxyl-terminal processing protease
MDASVLFGRLRGDGARRLQAFPLSAHGRRSKYGACTNRHPSGRFAQTLPAGLDTSGSFRDPNRRPKGAAGGSGVIENSLGCRMVHPPKRSLRAAAVVFLGVTGAAAALSAFRSTRPSEQATGARPSRADARALLLVTRGLISSRVSALGMPTEDDGAGARTLAFPTGEPPELGCDQARRIVAQARGSLAVPAETVDPSKFALATSDWLDPHGLWSVAPDSPISPALQARSLQLIAELEAAPGSGPCRAADELGTALEAWVADLSGDLETARVAARAGAPDLRHAWETAARTPFEDGPVTRRARDLARSLGRDVGAIERGYGAEVAPFADTAARRLAPRRPGDEWSRVLLAAAVRAYVPQIDPHGAWAPLDEETSIYDLELEVDPPERLWGEMTRTASGVRIDHGARDPLHDGDVVVEVNGLVLSGLSVEQDNQASVLGVDRVAHVTVLRAGAQAPLRLEISPEPVLLSPPPTTSGPDPSVSSREVGYGPTRALVVRVTDVPDDLGDRVAGCIHEARSDHEIGGVLLDLRGNGGGSTDGALGTLGVFLPGAPLFPMRRRDGEIEVDRAPILPPDLTWPGPVAALVDGDSASAAEMIAGALAAYERGIVVGTHTYGKGCAQEYLDDEGGTGVLRLTTLVFALPDGSPLQKVGVSPQIALGISPPGDREAGLLHAPATWRGPDVRSPRLLPSVPWPDHGGRIGVSDDPMLYRALRALGASRAAAR